MPSIDKSFLLTLQEDYTKYNTFIETGTYLGETIFELEPYFDSLYTVEFAYLYYSSSKNKYNGDKIEFIFGDSSIIFKTLLPTIKDKSIFF